jgi:hypothetical protein
MPEVYLRRTKEKRFLTNSVPELSMQDQKKLLCCKISARLLSTGFKEKCSYFKICVRNTHTGLRQKLHFVKSKSVVSLQDDNFFFFLYGSTALWTLAAFFRFSILCTLGRIPWTGDQPSQGRYLHPEQMHTDIHSSIRLRTHDLSVRAGEDGS